MKTSILAPLAGSVLAAACSTLPEPAATLPTVSLPHASQTAAAPSVADPKAIDWTSSNALAGALGGHAGHLRGHAASAPEGKP